jgi:hypothetical protein
MGLLSVAFEHARLENAWNEDQVYAGLVLVAVLVELGLLEAAIPNTEFQWRPDYITELRLRADRMETNTPLGRALGAILVGRLPGRNFTRARDAMRVLRDLPRRKVLEGWLDGEVDFVAIHPPEREGECGDV